MPNDRKGENMTTEADVRIWLNVHKGHRVRPLDIVFGAVEIMDLEITIDRNGTLEYDPAGETEVFWDSQTTVGMVCSDDYEEIICDEWVADIFPTRTEERTA
jgi:hypothetical protein